MAAAQSKLVHDFGIDCLLTCSDPAREVIDIAGREASTVRDQDLLF